VTRRIWKNLDGVYTRVHGAAVKDEPTGRGWHIRLLQPRAAG
jgi:hypothetical protein